MTAMERRQELTLKNDCWGQKNKALGLWVDTALGFTPRDSSKGALGIFEFWTDTSNEPSTKWNITLDDTSF